MGLFHEVDRGESRGDNHQQSGEEVRMGQHSMPLRSSSGNSFRQRQVMLWMRENLSPSGKDPMRSRKHSEKERTGYGLWTELSFRGRRTLPISRNVISEQRNG
ncbi:hypothetical protein Tco_0200510 [Tanacetum coccineum]